MAYAVGGSGIFAYSDFGDWRACKLWGNRYDTSGEPGSVGFIIVRSLGTLEKIADSTSRLGSGPNWGVAGVGSAKGGACLLRPDLGVAKRYASSIWKWEYATVTITRRMGIFALFAVLMVFGGSAPAWALPRLLVDMHSGEVLYAEEEGRPWHPASLTKLMTALVTFEAIKTGRVRLDTPVIISKRALDAPPSKVGFPIDTGITLEDALYLLIVKSANDIAIAIAETVSGSVERFADEMNQTAEILDMSVSHYVNPNGLHDPAQTTSARDIAVLSLTIKQHHPQFSQMFATKTVQLGDIKLRSHNELLTKFAGTTGMKTGFVCASGLNIVATAERGGRALMAVVLGGSSARERAELTAELMLKGFSGELGGTGWRVTDLTNQPGTGPFNMRPYICGAEARAFVAARTAAFSFGLEGQPTFLNDKVEAIVHRVGTLGLIRNVPLPRPRPLWAPGPGITLPSVPLPRPRPHLRSGG